MDPIVATIWLVRILFLALLYLFLFGVVRVLLRDLRAAAREPVTALGRLIVVASEVEEPALGTVFPLDAVATLGRDVNNTIVVDDGFASTEHAVLSFRGRAWYLEDLESTNGTYLNGAPIDGLASAAFGDEIQVGRVRFRLERAGK
ncbi:MAG: FHA domain-containing protein [Chloroflexota bacterium]|nr:FHA domain-containing protein [Chloroflexota bacterium]